MVVPVLVKRLEQAIKIDGAVPERRSQTMLHLEMLAQFGRRAHSAIPIVKQQLWPLHTKSGAHQRHIDIAMRKIDPRWRR